MAATGLLWWALLSGALSGRGGALVLAGGWTLTLLPVHATRWRRLRRRRRRPEPPAAEPDEAAEQPTAAAPE
ncbi:hypothetical protein [Phaeacidiphilus oryzae]|uniref:hypothetical protein n=1 Tax=Phaeacidiphilus oryzae TaxID=348818 RepID=UPI000564EDC9|nr:hypothetical protein [Phaeacidiphilus oryzae]